MIEASSMYGASSVMGSHLNHGNLINKSLGRINNTLNGVSNTNNNSKAGANTSYNQASLNYSHNPKLSKQANEYYAKAQKFMENKDYPNAIKNFQEFINLRLKSDGPKDAYVIMTYLQIAKVYEIEEKYLEGEKYAKQALSLACKRCGPGNYSLKPYIEELASLNSQLHDYKGAGQGYERVYDFELKKYGQNSLNLVDPLIKASSSYLNLKDYEDSDELYNKALKVLEFNNKDGKLNAKVKEVLEKIIEIRKTDTGLGSCTDYESKLKALTQN